jgi:hypothetical protein
MRPILISAALALLIFAGSAVGEVSDHNYRPPEGYIKDASVAVAVADAVLKPIYGKSTIARQSPLRARLENGVWIVTGRLPHGRLGGVAEIRISKATGEILQVTHGQ